MAFNLFKKVGYFLYSHRQFLVPLPKELREYPTARTQRTTLGQKFKDTFLAFAGKLAVFPGPRSNNPVPAKNPRLGIFDYLTLGIPRLASLLFRGAVALSGKHPILALVVLGLFVVSNIILMPLRYFVAAVATIAVSPVVLVTQFLKRYKLPLEYNPSCAFARS